MSIFSKLFSKFSANPLETHAAELESINQMADEIKQLTDEEIKSEMVGYQTELAEIKDDEAIFKRLQQLRPRVFALTRETSHRAIGQFHYDVQVVGGIVLSEGKIAEMKTGEGKTLTATLPLALHALAGKGAHLVTVNDYLARWQASLMGPIFHALGLSVASIQHEASFLYDPTFQPEAAEIEQIESQTQGLVLDVKHMRPVSRQEAYRAHITYGTNNEYGFDYLRDNMAQATAHLRQRDLFFAIVDEVDSILIDEARTPLIISQPDTDPTDKYYEFAKLVGQLQEHQDYTIDEKHKAASLTDDGITQLEQILKIDNIYDTGQGITTLHHIEQALKAKTLFKRDRDYVVRDGEIIIVDEFTGRLMFGRRYSEGLHQAIEAKEGVKIQQESKTLATITFQNLFRLYAKLSGMTGTAKTEEEEFFKIYKLEVTQIPTNRAMVRQDLSDLVYKNETGKFAAIAKDVKERNKKGQPVLIGTVSIAKNELLADYLRKEGVKFEILNAKNHEREAQIIAQAGRFGAVTLATNIAGRGVDILLGGNPIDPEEAERVREAGGLSVIGTERHESRRIDNQLRGRAGRQGDPGSSQFYVSMDDDLMRLFGGERMKRMMETLRLPDDEPIEAGIVSKSIESAQKKIEGLNFDTRKHVLEFDDVLNHQRAYIYKFRRKYLVSDDAAKAEMRTELLNKLQGEVQTIVTQAYALSAETPLEQIKQEINTLMPVDDAVLNAIQESATNSANAEFVIIDELSAHAEKLFIAKETEMGADNYLGLLSYIALRSIDTLWMEHLDTMDHLRDSVRLRGYGQIDPLVEYKKEGFRLFQNLRSEIDRQTIYTALKVGVQTHTEANGHEHRHIVLNKSDTGNELPTQVTTEPSDPRATNIGRNDLCYCGSGKKYKKCGLINSDEHQKHLKS